MIKKLRDIFREIGYPIPDSCKLIYDPCTGFGLVRMDETHAHWAEYEEGHHWTTFGTPVEPYRAQFMRAPDMSNYPANDCAAALVYWHVLEPQHG